jgi:hypothetical protein
MRPPRPLQEIEKKFKDLPAVSVQRKIARERTHALAVKAKLNERRVLRDFFRAYAAFVQTQFAFREVMRLMEKRQLLKAYEIGLNALLENQKLDAFVKHESPELHVVNADIAAWMKHFFRARAAQQQMLQSIPVF